MNKGEENYKDKTILILGGGDGALLNELLKESPKFVTMVDISFFGSGIFTIIFHGFTTLQLQ